MTKNNLSDQIIPLLAVSGLNDYDQRSALGMARSWIDNQKPIEWNVNQVRNEKRDQLARDVVAILQANPADEAEHVAALIEARFSVNAPFQVETHGGARLNKPGESKKAQEASK